jgi:hypothetical protein
MSLQRGRCIAARENNVPLISHPSVLSRKSPRIKWTVSKRFKPVDHPCANRWRLACAADSRSSGDAACFASNRLAFGWYWWPQVATNNTHCQIVNSTRQTRREVRSIPSASGPKHRDIPSFSNQPNADRSSRAGCIYVCQDAQRSSESSSLDRR